MSLHGVKLIKQIKDQINSDNLEKIYNEFNYIQESDDIKNSEDIICQLINIVGNYLVSAEKQNRPEDYAIFDTFCCFDFMSKFLQLSSYDSYLIDLQLIKSLSFLLINIKNKPSLYYLCSNNLLNKIISKDYSKYDDEFLSYYVNFLKSLSLLLDETSIQLFYIEKNNSFPLVENILKFYNHKDSMIRNVVRNTVMNILNVKNAKIEQHFSKLPSVLYFVRIVIRLRDICFQIKEHINNKNNKQISYLFDDLYDEIIYVDDLLNLKKEKINYILINCLFYFFIIPFLCGSICNKNKKITKEFSLFILIFLFINMKNETFKNCLFSLLFLDDLSSEIENLLSLDTDLNDFFINNININKETSDNEGDTNDISFYQFFSEHYSYYFLLTLIQKNNIIYNKYEKIYPQLKQIMESGNQLYAEINYGENNKNYTYQEIVQKLNDIIGKYFDSHELANMKNYHQHISNGTGLLIGELGSEHIINNGKEELINDKCFICYMKDIFSNNNKNPKKNIIKEGLLNLLKLTKEEILLLFNILLFVVQNKETNISKILLKMAKIDNVFDNSRLNSKNIKNIDMNSSNSDEINYQDSIKIYFNKQMFTFNNYYFSMSNIDLSDNKNNCQILESLSNLLILETPLLSITYQIIYQNIVNLSLDENYNCLVDINDNFIKNIESKYKTILYYIYSLFNNDPKNRENSYDILYNQWLLYKDMDNRYLFKTIKKNIISSMDILTLSNIDVNNEYSDYEYIEINTNLNNKNTNDSEILSRNKKENVSFESNILIFMLIYDLKKIFKKRQKDENFKICEKLLKNKFPLDYSSYDFQIGKKYNIDMIDPSKLYKQSVQYKIIDTQRNKEKPFMKCEIFFYRSFLYFGLRNNDDNNNVLVFKKIDIKLIEANKDYNQDEKENCVQLKLDDGNNEIIIIKFETKTSRKDFKDLINEKIMTSSNDERLLFSQYFEGLISKFKSNNIIKEDF